MEANANPNRHFMRSTIDFVFISSVFCNIFAQAQQQQTFASTSDVCNSLTTAQQCRQFTHACLWSGSTCYAIPCQVFESQQLCDSKQSGLDCAWHADENACVFAAPANLVSAVQSLAPRQQQIQRPVPQISAGVTSSAIAATLYSSCWLYTVQPDCVLVSANRINDDQCAWANNRCFPASLFGAGPPVGSVAPPVAPASTAPAAAASRGPPVAPAVAAPQLVSPVQTIPSPNQVLTFPILTNGGFQRSNDPQDQLPIFVGGDASFQQPNRIVAPIQRAVISTGR